ncbi:MAG: HEAT repeat domain-containing protein [Chloroflexi bacterium]|nr:HEAT repeat domain-containing protein [Chloroflexota bacterium]
MSPIVFVAIGFAIAIGLGVLVYTQRERLMALRSTAEDRVATTRASLTASLDERYRSALAEMANKLHLAGHLIPLEAVAVAPRFYTLPEPFDPINTEEPVSFSPFVLLPTIPDFPQYRANYNIPQMSLDNLLAGPQRTAILGAQGSGRTVALALLAIHAAEADTDHLPVYIHLGDMSLPEDASSLDPIRPLLAAAQARLKFIAGRALVAIQSEFVEGRGLILIDGWDDLTKADRQRALNWLRGFLDVYPESQVIMAGPVQGCRPLLELGFAAAYISPWNDADMRALVRLWAEHWPAIGKRRREPAAPPSSDLTQQAAFNVRGLPPIDLTLKIWAAYAGTASGSDRLGWYQAYIDRIVPDNIYQSVLEQLALELHNTPGKDTIDLTEATALFNQAREMAPEAPTMSPPDVLFAAKQTTLLTERTRSRLGFTHPQMRAYLAARALADAPFRTSVAQDTPNNRLLMPFLAGTQDITTYVDNRLEGPQTLGGGSLLQMALWMRGAPSDAPWRADVLRQIARVLLDEGKVFPVLRERAMAALVASRDPLAIDLLERGLNHADGTVRMLCCFGLGALGDPDSVIPLGRALEDDNAAVGIAATLALCALNDSTALNYIIQTLVAGSEIARRAAAESLATNLAGEGYEILRDATEEIDAGTRRAALYGLERVGPVTWVMDAVKDMMLHDSDWLVRSAATDTFERLEAGEKPIPYIPPTPADTKWMTGWLAKQSVDPGRGPQAIDQMIRMLQEADEPRQLAAAESLALHGSPQAILPLYERLRNPHPEIRDAAYRALVRVERAVGHNLPGVT